MVNDKGKYIKKNNETKESVELIRHSIYGGKILCSSEDSHFPSENMEDLIMAFFQSAVGTLQTLVIALGAGLGIWGAINLMEGYGNDNPGAKSQGMKQLMAGGGVALIGTTLVPLLSGLF